MSGGIIVSIANNVYNTLYGDIQGPMKALLEQAYEGSRKEQLTLWEKIFKPFKLDTNSATIAGIGTIGLFEDVGENGEYPLTSPGSGFNKVITAEEWKLAYYISQTMMEDKLDFVLRDQPGRLTDSFVRTKNSFYCGLFNAAAKGVDYVTAKKHKISIKTMDGVNLFSSNHKLANDRRTVSNAFSNEFSASALGKVATKMQNMRDDNGEIIGIVPNTIIIPNTEKAKSEVFGVIGAHNDPDTQAGNRYNYQFGNWDVLVLPWLEELVAADGSYPWFLMDTNYNEHNYGALAVERIPLSVRSSIDESNDANRWAGRARFGGAFVDFRAFAGGGLEYGDEL